MIWTHKINYLTVLSRRLKSSTTQILQKENLPATAYKPEIVEKSKYNKWESNGYFEALESSGKPTYSMVLPPPNITGKLHLG